MFAEQVEQSRAACDEAQINLVYGASGPPLLLHGYPQTHVMWHQLAPALAERFHVVCADLRGYADGTKSARYPFLAFVGTSLETVKKKGTDHFCPDPGRQTHSHALY